MRVSFEELPPAPKVALIIKVAFQLTKLGLVLSFIVPIPLEFASTIVSLVIVAESVPKPTLPERFPKRINIIRRRSAIDATPMAQPITVFISMSLPLPFLTMIY